LSGMIGSKKIIAINKDSEAPIFEAADYGVVGPYEDILPAFMKGLKVSS
jgi:electron transfer flavoprotein alpha subunit